ncbi:MAG: GWxTD domain-containing protein [Candidatus Aminicenantes bacterium]|nr:GWxTD domain-containing protein [Candidatus Aminicenantes bacterium]
MPKRAVVFILAGLCLASSLSAQRRDLTDPKTLALKYQDWLKLVTYHIKDVEREVFLTLKSDLDRDIFITNFWKIRDPTPATPENEYHEDLVKRFTEANRRFRSAREGWMTDRGRVYIALGPPLSTTRIEGSNDLWPIEIWSYNGDVSKKMPSHFQLAFFQRANAGEYKLYDPLSDGPFALMVNGRQYDQSDYETAFQDIFNWQPDVAAVALSIIPGDVPYNYTPTPDSAIMMANIMESPKVAVDDTYATHFLKYKGMVETEYLTNSIDSRVYAAILTDPVTGMAFCHFGMAPSKLSMDYYEPKDEYSANFQMDVSLRAGDKVVLQYAKEYPVTIPAERIADTENTGLAIEDSFPVVEGTFQLTVLLRNVVGKEFSVLERPLVVPPKAERPTLGSIITGYRAAETRVDAHAPFLVADRKISVEPESIFAADDRIVFLVQAFGVKDDLRRNGSVRVSVKGIKPSGASQKTLNLRLDSQPLRETMTFFPELAAAELSPDNYDVKISLLDAGGNVLSEKTTGFSLETKASKSHPGAVSKTTPSTGRFLFQYMRAYQYAQLDRVDLAEAAYKSAFGQNPGYLQKVPEYAGFLIRIGKNDEALELAETLRSDERFRYSYFLTKGMALYAKGRFAEAAETLAEGNRIYNSDITLLNALGESYFKIGRNQDALVVLNASIKLNPEQPAIKRMIEEIQRKK